MGTTFHDCHDCHCDLVILPSACKLYNPFIFKGRAYPTSEVFNKTPCLEHPMSSRHACKKGLKPVHGMEIHVEAVDSTMNIQKLFVPLYIQFSGLTATHREPDTAHVWRFCRRDALSNYEGSHDWTVECTHRGTKVNQIVQMMWSFFSSNA